MKTIEEFCDQHYACREGREWALKNCKNMRDAWDKCERPEWIVWIATRNGVLTQNELVKFSVWAARQVQNLMKDARSMSLLDVVEKYISGNATKEELLSAARNAAYVANATAAFANAAAYAAAAFANVANAADFANAVAAAADAAADATSQAKWLREHTNPNFS